MSFWGNGGNNNQQSNNPQYNNNQRITRTSTGSSSYMNSETIEPDIAGKALQSANGNRNLIGAIVIILLVGGLMQGYFTAKERDQLRQQPVERVR